MMAEYIDREKAKEELLSWAVCINHPEHLLKEDALCVIDNIPAADVAVVKHGRWIPLEYDGYADGFPVWALWECSQCQEEHSGDEDTLTPYCPQCGAKMDLEVTNGLDQH